MDPATMDALASAGQFLGGAGSFAKALGIGGDKGTSATDVNHQYMMNLEHQQRSFDLKMDLAKKHGLHPLVAMGINGSGFSPTFIAGETPDLAGAGYGINQMARSMVKPPESDPDPLSQRLAEANLRTAEANAKAAEWRALQMEFQTVDMANPVVSGQPGVTPSARVSNDVAAVTRFAASQSGIPGSLIAGGEPPIKLKQEVLPPHPLQLGHAAGADQAWIIGFDHTGKPFRMLNPNLLQTDFEQGATMNALAERFGVSRARDIAAFLEQAPVIGGLIAGAGYAGKKAYDYFGNQRREVEKRRPGKWAGSIRFRGKGGD